MQSALCHKNNENTKIKIEKMYYIKHKQENKKGKEFLLREEWQTMLIAIVAHRLSFHVLQHSQPVAP